MIIVLGLNVLFFLLGNMSVLSSPRHQSCVMHVDMDCFFVSVGIRNRPDLKGLYSCLRKLIHCYEYILIYVLIDNKVFFERYFDFPCLDQFFQIIRTPLSGIGKLENLCLIEVEICREEYLKLRLFYLA